MKNVILYFFILLFLFCCTKNKKPDMLLIVDRVDNLNTNSEVKINGLVVGRVIGMKLLDNGILVSIHFAKPTNISVDSDFRIIAPLVGSAYVSITLGNEKTFLTNKDTARGIHDFTKPLDNLLSDSTTKKKINDFLDKIINGFDSLRLLRKDSAYNYLNN